MNLAEKTCMVFDCDGTIYLGGNPLPGAIDFIRRQEARGVAVYYLSNNTSHTPDDYVTKLGGMGLNATPENILSPIFPLLDWINDHAATRIFLLANTRLTHYITDHVPGLNTADGSDECDAVVLAMDTEVTYKRLETASLLLQHYADIPFLCTHPDARCPTAKGFVPDAGAMAELIKAASGRGPDIIFGKPNPNMMKRILNRFDVNDIVVVGDRLNTDKKLADNVGCDFISVLTGITSRADIDALPADEKPALVVDGIGTLLNRIP